MWRKIGECDETISCQCLTCHEYYNMSCDANPCKFCPYCGNRLGKQFTKINKRWDGKLPIRFYFWWVLEELKIIDDRKDSFSSIFHYSKYSRSEQVIIENQPIWRICRTISSDEFVRQRKHDPKLFRHKNLLESIKDHQKRGIPIRLKAFYPDKSQKILKQWG